MPSLLLSVVLALALLAAPLAGQETAPNAEPDAPAARVGSEFRIPLGSFLLPGLGQFLHGAPRPGAAFAATTAAGYALTGVGDAWGETWTGGIPRRGRDQFAEQALHATVTAGSLSAWDAFHRAVPALQGEGKYEFLVRRERVGDLLSAPFDTRFLRRWTTWVDLAQTAAVTALVLSERRSGAVYEPFRANDAAWAASLSMNAAVGEEALFRGWLLPLLYQHTDRFWLANGMQATLFGAAHLPDASWFAVHIGAWAAWEGWLVRRNEWSIRESIFHHFWYDVAVVTATLLSQEQSREVRITFPTITF
jgi:membrane protease YdiL (CAAX protease family)